MGGAGKLSHDHSREEKHQPSVPLSQVCPSIPTKFAPETLHLKATVILAQISHTKYRSIIAFYLYYILGVNLKCWKMIHLWFINSAKYIMKYDMLENAAWDSNLLWRGKIKARTATTLEVLIENATRNGRSTYNVHCPSRAPPFIMESPPRGPPLQPWERWEEA